MVPQVMKCPDGHFHRIICSIGPYIADYPEQVLISRIVQNWCGRFPFTEDFPHADIWQLLALDILHQLIKGGFKDHLVEWVGKYLELMYGKASAKEQLADIDCR
ncbi:hypothetical protein F5141DRAFT_1008858 [Pisolithus sp. B1]|nr:hypothetical protein F5141DRAFT_1008858 [Pisolithus sp. B1]